MTRFLTEKEAAEVFGLSIHTLRKWRSTGNPRGPRYVLLGGRAVRYDLKDLEAWAASGRVGGQQEAEERDAA